MIVTDASVVVAALLSGGGAGARAREVLRRDPDLHAPHLLDVEVTAALGRRVRLGQTKLTLADEALADLGQLPVLRWGHEPLVGRVWAMRDNVSTYDAMYVALAEVLDAPLLTTDLRLAHAPGLTCPVEVLLD